MTKRNGAADEPARPDNWRQVFLDTLGQTSNVTAAASEAGVSVSKAYGARRAEPEFAAQWFSALCEGYDNLELELLSRLRSGDAEPADSAEKKAQRKFDNAVAFRLLSAHRESVGKERARQDSSDEADTIASINAKLDLMRARLGDASGEVDDGEGSWLKAELSSAFQGGLNAGRPMLLEGGLKWQPLSMSPADGDGINQPLGFLNEDASRAFGSVQLIGSGDADGFGAEPELKLIDLVHTLKPGPRQGASWVMNSSTMAEVRKLKTSDNLSLARFNQRNARFRDRFCR